MIRVAINGACGRMGKRLVAVAHSQKDMQVVAAIEAPGHPDVKRDAGAVAGIGDIGVEVECQLTVSADVMIDFSSPEATVEHTERCAERGIACVIGTTGISDAQQQRLRGVTESVPVLLAPNMSVGVNVAFEAASMLAQALGEDFDVEIVETHHRMKKDAPSGTALGFAERIAEALGRDLAKDAVYGRQGMVGERGAKEIGIHAVRAGDVVGEHTIIFASQGERVELTHRATNRDIFVNGAVRMARILVGKKPGLYSVKNLLIG